MNDCPICNEGKTKLIIDYQKGIKLYYRICEICESQTSSFLEMNFNNRSNFKKQNVEISKYK